MSKPQYYEIVENISVPEDIISRNIKTQTLNTLSLDLTTMRSNITDRLLITKIDYILNSIEDAYKIDMYRFQFKVFIDIVTKEMQDIKNSIALL